MLSANRKAHRRRIVLSTLRETVEKLRRLDAEKKNLLVEMEELKKLTESKATALESEVRILKEEVESLRTLLGVKDEFSSDPRKTEKWKPKFNIK